MQRGVVTLQSVSNYYITKHSYFQVILSWFDPERSKSKSIKGSINALI